MRLKSMCLSLTALAILVLQPAESMAQQDGDGTAKPPRPKVLHDHKFSYGPEAYPVFIYFEEGKSFGDATAHVFYSPVLFLVTNEDGSINKKVRDRGNEGIELVLLVYPEEDERSLHTAILVELDNVARVETGIPNYGTTPYRINPLTMSRSWFEAGKKRDGTSRFISVDVDSTTMTENTAHSVSFYFDTKDAASDFVAELEEGYTKLKYQYAFAGVSDDICAVEFKGDEIQNIDLFKKVTGEGRKGYVSRDQAANIADKIVSTEDLATRCGDWEVGSWFIEQLMNRIDKHKEKKVVTSWAELEELTELDADSFKADVETMIEDIKKETKRDIEVNAASLAISIASSTATEGGGMGGIVIGPVAAGGGGSGSTSESGSVTLAAAQKRISDGLEKKGIYGKWEGNRYTPKSVDVYSKGGLESTWSQNVKETYSQLRGGEGIHGFLLTEKARRLLPKIGEARIERLARNLRESVRREVRELEVLVLRATTRADAAGNIARSAKIDAEEALDLAKGLLSQE